MSSYCRIFLLGLAALVGSAVSSSVAFANVRLAFDSTSLDFSNVPLTGSKTLTIEVWDTASIDNIEIDRFDLTGTNAGDFSVISDSATPFVALADSGNNIKIYVTFSPESNGPRTGFLEVETSDGIVYISLSGIGGEKSSLAWSVSSIDFGLLGPGAKQDTVIELYSTGPDSATISAIEIASADASFAAQTVSGVQAPFTLGPGDSVAVDVSFKGLVPIGEKEAQLIIYGATLNEAECDLNGDVELGDFHLVPPTIDFGTMYAGEVRDTTIMVENTGDVPIVIGSLGIDPDGDDFTLLIPNDTQLAISPGGKVPLTVRANPGLNTSHTAALYAVSQSADTSYKSITLVVSVVPPSLTNPPNQSLSYFCAVIGPEQFTLPISDTGSSSLLITNFVSNDSNVILSTDPAIPDTLAPGEAQSLIVQFDPSKITGDTLVIEGLGGEKIMIQDTVFLQPMVSLATMSLNSLGEQSGTQENFDISSQTALTQFGIDTIIVHVSVEDTNVASISSTDIKLSPGITNATITSVQTEPGGYAVTIASSSPINLAAGSQLLTIGFSRFVSIEDSSNVFIAIETPEKSGCLDWILDTSSVQGATVCGSDVMQDAMSGLPMIINAVLRENPITDGYANIKINSNFGISQARYSITNAIGESVSDGTLDLVAGENNRVFSLSGFPSGVYVLRIVTMDGFSTGLRLIKLD